MEDKLTKRQNDIIKALTCKLADKTEVEKKFRLTNNDIKKLRESIEQGSIGATFGVQEP
jgi:hypothetical protein